MPVLYTWMRILAFSVFLFGWSISADANPNRGQVQAEVIVCGGSTAGLATALAAAEEGAEVVLLEPTDWVGGQLTSSGVPAVDEAWHVISEKNSDRIALRVKDIARDPRNMTPAFRDILSRIGNPGKGWVSRYCFEPKRLLEDHLIPWERRLAGRLTIYRNTVIKRVELTEEARQNRL